MNPTRLATHEAEIDGSYAWFRLVVSMLLASIGGVGLWAAVVIIPAVQAEFGVVRADASLPYTVAMIGFGAGNVVIGYAIDRWGYWRPALVASLGLAAGFGLAAIATSIIQIALIHGLLIGLGSSAIFGPLIADISHWFERRRGIAVSIAAAGNYIAGAIWPLIMPRIMELSNWRVTYAVIGGVCLVTMVPLVLLLRRAGAVPRQRVTCDAHAQANRALAGARCRCCSSSPALPAAPPCRCRRCISSPTAPISATASRAARKCCR